MCAIDSDVCAFLLTPERSQDVSDFCQSVLSLDRDIVFAGAINKNGRVIESKLRDDGIIKKFNSKELEMLFMQCSLRESMIKDFDTKLGSSKYTLVERDSVSELVFPFHLGIILVLMSPHIYPRKLARKISKLVNEFDLWTEARKLR